ncbi:L-lactate dehydrogenase [[Mycoplasma] cavipharyngis]|uniref:L-lactate dehydrogenase n=1 Tax=[Mycoplasma] cavipharyngis TaxID=92757 RepID=UPI003704C721
MKQTKIAFLGCGAVGMSSLYAALQQNLASEYGLLDVFADPRDGNVLDFQDACSFLREGSNVKAYDYHDLKDVDIIVISAGLPQKPEQTRLELIEDNRKIIEEIGRKIKSSGFTGITIMVSNPVDLMTYHYIKATGFDHNRVIGSGTVLDSSRLRYFIGSDLNISPIDIQGYVIGEHGDSSLVAFSAISINGIPLRHFKSKYNDSNYETDLETPIRRKAYEIIKRKRATFYGIGGGVAKLIRAIVYDSKQIIACGPLLHGEYGYQDIVFGTPCVIGANGIEKILELPLNEKEKAKLKNSVEVLKSYLMK